MVALVDADDRHHDVIADLFAQRHDEWLVPWATLPEIDYLLGTHVGRRAQDAFLTDLAECAFRVELGNQQDIERARSLHQRYRDQQLVLVDGVVMAVAERVKAQAIATVDLKHFGAVKLRGRPKLLPRDL
jgi:predicted nucleic acid-binding protein